MKTQAVITLLAALTVYIFIKMYVARSLIWERQKKGLVRSLNLKFAPLSALLVLNAASPSHLAIHSSLAICSTSNPFSINFHPMLITRMLWATSLGSTSRPMGATISTCGLFQVFSSLLCPPILPIKSMQTLICPCNGPNSCLDGSNLSLEVQTCLTCESEIGSHDEQCSVEHSAHRT